MERGDCHRPCKSPPRSVPEYAHGRVPGPGVGSVFGSVEAFPDSSLRELLLVPGSGTRPGSETNSWGPIHLHEILQQRQRPELGLQLGPWPGLEPTTIRKQ